MRHPSVVLTVVVLALTGACERRHVATPAPTAEPADRPSQDRTQEQEELPEGLEAPPGDDKGGKGAAPAAKDTENLAVPKPAPPKPSGAPAKGPPNKPTTPAKTGAAAPSTPAPGTNPPSTSTATPTKKTVLPQTGHVRFEVTAAMQKLLDADTRMEAWLKRILPVIDGCYRELSTRSAGVITVSITMHENSRPGTAIKSIPGNLASLLPCATTRLMNARPPLFTGPEGQTHTVGIRFTP